MIQRPTIAYPSQSWTVTWGVYEEQLSTSKKVRTVTLKTGRGECTSHMHISSKGRSLNLAWGSKLGQAELTFSVTGSSRELEFARRLNFFRWCLLERRRPQIGNSWNSGWFLCYCLFKAGVKFCTDQPTVASISLRVELKVHCAGRYWYCSQIRWKALVNTSNTGPINK